jgi:Xaa-Pro dipeptidase
MAGQKFVEKRIEKVFAHLGEDPDVEAVLIFNGARPDGNFTYLTGIAGLFENCGFLFDRDGKRVILTTTLEEEILRSLEGLAEFSVYRTRDERAETLRSRLSGYSSIGLCFGSVSHSLYLELEDMLRDIRLVDAGEALTVSRMTKFDDEIAKVESGCAIVSDVADDLPGLLREGMTERELAAEIDYRIKKRGGAGPSFPTIVAFGENSSKPHHASGNRTLSRGDLVLADFGAYVEGYASDISRTYLTEPAGTEQKRLYATVLEAQHMALDMIADAVSVDEVDKKVRGFIDGIERYRGRFIHSLGHSLGVDVHDGSYPSKRFAVDMVLTVEPGVYLPEVGGVRIEDDIVVEETSCRILTHASKEPDPHEI